MNKLSINKQLHSFYIALSFLTRIRTPLEDNITQKQMGDAIVYYPLVGFLMGLSFYLITQLIFFFSTDFPPDVLAAVLLILWVLITGGLHIDGLADSADAWIGGLNDRERTLEIMKDPYCGPIGVAVVVLVLLLKWTAISHLLNTDQAAFLIVLPMLSRAIIIVLFMSTVYVRESGLGTALLEYMPKEKILLPLLLVSALLYIIFASLYSLLLAVITIMALRVLMIQRIGGMTGDTLGASIEIAEAVALLGLVF